MDIYQPHQSQAHLNPTWSSIILSPSYNFYIPDNIIYFVPVSSMMGDLF